MTFHGTVKELMNATDNVTQIGRLPDPDSLEEVMKRDDKENWLKACTNEIASLFSNGTFDVVDIPKNVKPVAVKWVFKTKYDAFGFLEKYKARVVAKGFLQQYGVDYFDIFSPVTKLPTLRTLLSYVALNDLELKHLDVSTAFLNGELKEEVYIAVPPGLEKTYKDKCFKLRKAIYGLRQAPRVWWLNLSKKLQDNGFKSTFADQCLFTKEGKHGKVFMLVYVDDILIAGHNEDVADATEIIMKSYKSVDNGDARSFLGMAITRDRRNRTITLSQPNYVNEVAKKHNFAINVDYSGHTVPMSIPQSKDGSFDKGTPLNTNVQKYPALIGSLLYLANCTRPDISYAVSTLARHLREPDTVHWYHAKKLLSYCLATKDQGLVYGEHSYHNRDVEIEGYCDSDYASAVLNLKDEQITRRSVTGYVFFANGTPIAWQSKKQVTVSRSSDEAEYQALATASSMGLWLRKLMAEITGSVKPITINGDNQAALLHVNHPGSINRSKHVDIAHQFVLDRALRHDLKFVYVNTAENIADMFTKAVAAKVFFYLKEKLGVKRI